MARFPSNIRFQVQITPNKNVGNWNKTSITIHWWGLPSAGATFDGVLRWFMTPSARASAHYTVESGRIAQQVMEKDAAWHAGVTAGNRGSIGIEVNPRWRDGDYETVAQLVAEIWRRRGRELPLKRHRDWKATQCPGPADLNRIRNRARAINRARTGGASSSAPAPGQSSVNTGGTASGGQYTVKRGDSLSVIAKRYGTSTAALQFLNGIDNPHRIQPGQLLYTRWHITQGQSLSEVASLYNRSNYTRRVTSAQQLANLSNIGNPDRVNVGQLVRLP